MLYPLDKSIKIVILRSLWDTQKNIEAVEKWAQKKEEQEKRIRKNSIYSLIQPPPSTLSPN